MENCSFCAVMYLVKPYFYYNDLGMILLSQKSCIISVQSTSKKLEVFLLHCYIFFLLFVTDKRHNITDEEREHVKYWYDYLDKGKSSCSF